MQGLSRFFDLTVNQTTIDGANTVQVVVSDQDHHILFQGSVSGLGLGRVKDACHELFDQALMGMIRRAE